MSDSVPPHSWQPTRLPCPWDSPGKNTGMGCHFLLQCMKVKSETEVAQSCPTPRDPMDCSPPGSSAHGILQSRVLEWGAIAFSATHKRGRNMRTLPSPTRGLSHNMAYFNKQLTFKSRIILARSSLSRIRLRVNEFCVRNREQLSVSIGFPYLKSLPTWEGE